MPFSIFVHEDDLISATALWSKIGDPVMRSLERCHDRPLGAEYAEERRRTTSLAQAEGSLHLAKESGVVVLGHDSGSDLTELERVCDRLRSMGYDARLIREMAEIPSMSNEEKVRLSTLASRFVVMIDRQPSGHIVEHELMKEQRNILAIVRPRGHGSSYMIGDAGLVDLNYIRVFKFDYFPEDVLPAAVEWAESIATERQRRYDSYYPWRNAKS